MLKGNGVESRVIQKLGCQGIIRDGFVAYLETHRRRIIGGTARIRHGDGARIEIGAFCRNCPAKIAGEGRDSAAARRIIPNEGKALKWLYCILRSSPSRRGHWRLFEKSWHPHLLATLAKAAIGPAQKAETSIVQQGPLHDTGRKELCSHDACVG
jgi:hypothetical protein